MTIDIKTKELIAIGASIITNCQPCLRYHLKIAEDSGATEEEIKDAIKIAGFVKSKSSTIMDKFAVEVLSRGKISLEESCPEKSSESSVVCCG